MVLGRLISHDLAVVSAGTTISLQDKKLFESMIGKTGASAGMKLVEIIDFRRLSRSDTKALLSRLLNIEKLNIKNLDTLCARIAGRARFSMVVAESIINALVKKSEKDITELINDAIEDLLVGEGLTSLRTAILKMQERINKDKVNEELADLIVAVIACQGLVGRTSDCRIDLLAFGLCFIEKCGSSVFVIKEQLIFEAAVRFLDNEGISFTEAYIIPKVVSLNSSSSHLGDLFDLAIALGWCEMEGAEEVELTYENILKPFSSDDMPLPPWTQAEIALKWQVIGRSHREWLGYVKANYGIATPQLQQFLSQSMKNDSQYLMPDTKDPHKHPDGCAPDIKASVAVVICNKFSAATATVAKQECESNIKESDIARHSVPFEYHYKYLIRIHHTLPAVASTLSDSVVYKPGLRFINSDEIAIVNVDNSNIEKCAWLPPKVALIFKLKACASSPS